MKSKLPLGENQHEALFLVPQSFLSIDYTGRKTIVACTTLRKVLRTLRARHIEK